VFFKDNVFYLLLLLLLLLLLIVNYLYIFLLHNA